MVALQALPSESLLSFVSALHALGIMPQKCSRILSSLFAASIAAIIPALVFVVLSRLKLICTGSVGADVERLNSKAAENPAAMYLAITI
jgi:hypothetical protein